MATNQSGRESKGVCEKVYSAITASPAFRKIHRTAQGQQNFSAQLPTYDQFGSGKEVFIESDDSRLPNEMTAKFDTPKIGPPGQSEVQVPKFGSNRGVVVELEKPKPKTKIGMNQETKATSEPVISTPSRRQIETPPSPLVQGEKNSLETVQEGRTKLQTKQPKKQSSSIHDKGEGHHKVGDDKFSEFINKVKSKLRAPSNVGVAKIGVSKRQDSFNDRVTNYIHSAKLKIRTTKTVGADVNTLSSSK